MLAVDGQIIEEQKQDSSESNSLEEEEVFCQQQI